MTQTATRPGEDFATWLLIVAVLIAALLSLTVVGVAASGFALTIYWLTGRPNAAAVNLTAGVALVLLAYFFGLYGVAFSLLGDAYATAWRQGLTLERLFWAWTILWDSPSGWGALAPFGLIVGGCLALIAYSRQQSPLVALSQGRVLAPPRRAPLARILHRRLASRPPRQGSAIVLGSNWRTGDGVQISDADLNRHVLITGTTGAGKTNTILNLVEGIADAGLVIIDGKGDLNLARRVAKFAAQRKQKFSLFEPTGALPSAVYNPFACGDYTSLTDRVMSVREWTEPHYAIISEGFAQAALKTLLACGRAVDLLGLADALSVDSLQRMIKEASRGSENKETFKTLINEVETLRDEEKDISGLRAELRNLSRSTLGPLFDTARARRENIPIIELDRARTEKSITYFCLPALIYPKRANYLGRMIINDLRFVTSLERTPWPLILDEFSVFAGDQALNLLNQGREFGLRVILGTQSFADIARGVEVGAGDTFVTQVLESINTLIIHRMLSSKDREVAATETGTREAIERTVQTVGGIGTGAASSRFVQQFIAHPDAVRRLEDGVAFVVDRNHDTTVLTKIRKSSI